MSQQDFYINTLIEKQIRPSFQRLTIFKYIYDHRTHPTVDMVYDDLSPLYPTLSKTTVYNTLHLFKEHNLVQELRIEGDEIRYDAETRPHMHFKCEKCGKIFDLFARDEEEIASVSQNIRSKLEEGFLLSTVEINLKGTCKDCR